MIRSLLTHYWMQWMQHKLFQEYILQGGGGTVDWLSERCGFFIGTWSQDCTVQKLSSYWRNAWIATHSASRTPTLTLKFKKRTTHVQLPNLHRVQAPANASFTGCEALMSRTHSSGRLCLWSLQLMILGVLHCELRQGGSLGSHFGVKNQQSPVRGFGSKSLPVCLYVCWCMSVCDTARDLFKRQPSLYQTNVLFFSWNI